MAGPNSDKNLIKCISLKATPPAGRILLYLLYNWSVWMMIAPCNGLVAQAGLFPSLSPHRLQTPLALHKAGRYSRWMDGWMDFSCFLRVQLNWWHCMLVGCLSHVKDMIFSNHLFTDQVTIDRWLDAPDVLPPCRRVHIVLFPLDGTKGIKVNTSHKHSYYFISV